MEFRSSWSEFISPADAVLMPLIPRKESYVKNYEGANIRNVALVGHSHSGKTSLASSMLFTAGATQRLGRVDEGNTTTDYDEEEISRAMSIAAATAVVEWGKTKINLHRYPRLQHVHP